jgi:CheY-like chemotaxis protein
MAKKIKDADYGTILIADDEPADIQFIQDLFQRASIHNPTRVVADGEAVIDYLKGRGDYQNRRQHPFPVLLLLDLVMPKKSGWEVLTWLASLPEKPAMDVVVVSKASDFDSQKVAFECGAQSFLIKPFGVESLMNLFNALRHAQLEARQNGYELTRCEGRPAWFV